MPEHTLSTETAQAIAAGMPVCPNCAGRNVRASHAIRFEDKLRGMFHFTPYRCRTCQNRFYSRPRPAAPAVSTDQPQAG
jgi:transposase-like protein